MTLNIRHAMKLAFTLTVGLLVSAPAFAINGYFLLGYGAKQLGMAGAGVALPQDRIVGAINPAGMTLVAPGFDVGIGVMHPIRGGEIDCRGIGACDREVSDSSRREIFAVPTMGYSRRLADGSTLGLTLYANGGLNSTYDRALYEEAIARITGAVGGKAYLTDKLGVDFGQFVFAPSLSKTFGPVALGISPLIQLQRFKAYGFGAFAGLSTDAGSLPAAMQSSRFLSVRPEPERRMARRRGM
jgi:long-chain fatty acid transport protein